MGTVLTTHLMDDAQRLADYVYIIDAGRNVAEEQRLSPRTLPPRP
jgi:ABC-2 type transport system ATP-binding protein